MVKKSEGEKRWERISAEIDRDTETVSFNVGVPKSLKREITFEKARSGKKYKDLAVQAWSEYLKRQYTGKED